MSKRVMIAPSELYNLLMSEAREIQYCLEIGLGDKEWIKTLVGPRIKTYRRLVKKIPWFPPDRTPLIPKGKAGRIAGFRIERKKALEATKV